MTIQEIKSIDCKKHIKIFLLKRSGLSNKEIAAELSTNTGHVRNELIKYDKDPERVEKALKIAI